MTTATKSPTLQHEAAPRTQRRTPPSIEAGNLSTNTADADMVERIEQQLEQQAPVFRATGGEISAVRRGEQ